MSKRRKSVSRRRSRSLVGFVSRDLCQTVPKSLSPSDRLMMLLDQSFQYALSVVQKDVMFQKDFDISDFRQNGSKCWEKIKAAIEEKDLHKSAVGVNLGVNEVFDSSVKGNSEECNKSIALMDAESEKWSSKMSYYRECLTKELDFSYPVNPSGLEMKDQQFDYSNILSETFAMEKKLLQQIASVQSSRNIIEESLNVHKICHASSQQQICAKYSHKTISRTPRTIIRGFGSLRSRIKPCDVKK